MGGSLSNLKKKPLIHSDFQVSQIARFSGLSRGMDGVEQPDAVNDMAEDCEQAIFFQKGNLQKNEKPPSFDPNFFSVKLG